MRAILKTTLVLAGIVAAVPACGSDPADALAGEWKGQCATQTGGGDLDATISFSDDGKYTQTVDGNEVSGTYTATDKSVSLTAPTGESVNAEYSVDGDSLTLTTPGESTCDLKRS